MCGIVGIVDSKGRPIQRELIQKMLSTIRHRGPDGDGFYFNQTNETLNSSSVSFAHARLKVIDLVTGDQPLSNEKGDIWIVYNGEIYNYLELRTILVSRGHNFKTQSDTEVIVHSYEEFGPECVRYLRGMFSFAIWDGHNNSCMLVRDRLGKKPLVYALRDGQLLFASELSALIKHPLIERQPDYEAVHHYLTYMCIPSPLTGFKNVNKLPPAHYLIFENGDTKIYKYWELDFSKKRNIDERQALYKANQLIEESVKLRLRSDVELGVFLSGGMDSSSIVSVASRLYPGRLKTFSIGFDNAKFNELPFARIVAKRFNTDHHEEIVHARAIDILPSLAVLYGEPFADSSALPSYYLSQMTKKHVTVVLNGDGGDEVFGGYYRFLAMRLADIFYRLPSWFKKGFIGPIAAITPQMHLGGNKRLSLKRFINAADQERAMRWLRWVGYFSEAQKRSLYSEWMNEQTKGLDSSVYFKELFTKVSSLDGVDASMEVDTKFYLPYDLLVKMDIASMAHSLEARSPFLDHLLVEFMASLPATLKVKGFQLKYLLRKLQAEYLPREILRRHKQGFAVPLGDWLRGELSDFVKGLLLSKKANSRLIFQPEQIKNILQIHITGSADMSHEIWMLIMLEMWFLEMVD